MFKMRKYRVLKFLSLTVLYAALIIGVFVLQFKTETVIAQNIGGMELSLSSAKDKDGNDILKNRFRIAYKGLTFSSNENNCATAYLAGSDGAKEKLVLTSWNKSADGEVLLDFAGGVSLKFSSIYKGQSSADSSEPVSAPLLVITANLPENYERVAVPYTISDSYEVNRLETRAISLKTGDSYFMLAGPVWEGSVAVFSANSAVATYRPYTPVTEFHYASVTGLPFTDQTSYNQTKSALKAQLRTKFQAAVSANTTFSEKAVTAYVADMASDNKFNMALNLVPAAYKTGGSRTYLSAPFFADLAFKNESLRSTTARLSNAMNAAVASKDLEIFTKDGLADYLLLQKLNPLSVQVLHIPSEIPAFEPTLAQAVAILHVYCALDAEDASFADNLGGCIDKCISVIASYLTLDGERIVVGKRADSDAAEVELSRTERILLGQTLVDYGDAVGDEAILGTGRLLVSTEIDNASSLSLSEIGEVYHRVIKENRFYPHVQVFGYYGKNPVWAWTCAPNIDYKIAENGTTDITIDFTLSYTHYVIFTGIPTFHMNIEIQQLKFRSDKNFEIYNSSGFIYNESLSTLFLKSRHKSQKELIRLFCDPPANFTAPSKSSR